MSELRKQIAEWTEAARRRLPPWSERALIVVLIALGIVFPFFFSASSDFLDKTCITLGYVVMALGLNVVVGFAGLLDLGYVAFYALGAYCMGWFGSSFVFNAHLHVLVTGTAATGIGIHLNFLLIAIIAAIVTAAGGALIGLPTLRLRSDYIAIVTLAFGEIIYVVARNGASVDLGGGQPLTAGAQGISALDAPYIPGLGVFNPYQLRPWYWLIFAIALLVVFICVRLRESRLGRAWVALREDEVAAVSMGIPLVKTKLSAYAIGAAFGGCSGAYLGALQGTVNSDQFRFQFSIFVLSMVIVGGLGSIWGVILGAVTLSYINYYIIPNVLNTLPSKFGLNFQLTDLQFGIFGFLLVLVMILRPQGLLPERRRRLEITGEISAEDAQLSADGSAPGAPVG